MAEATPQHSSQALFEQAYAQISVAQIESARQTLLQLLQQEPSTSELYQNARFNLGATYQAQGRHDLALGHYEGAFNQARALGMQAAADRFIGNLLNAKMRCCDWQGLHALQYDIAQRTLGGELVCPPFQILSFSGSLALQKKAAQLWVGRSFNEYVRLPLQWDGKRRIRVAYVSTDFRNHPVAYLTAGLFEAHDKTQFEIFAINTGAVSSDAHQNRIRAAASGFVEASSLNDAELVNLVRGLQVDIAMDLTGLTQGGRAEAFAQRMAPIQGHYLGYPATSQIANMDFIVADPVLIAQDMEPHFSERIMRLPLTFQVSDPLRPQPVQGLGRGDFGLPEDKFIFCSFANTYKITPAMFALWMRILHGSKNTVLLLYANDAYTEHHLRQAAHAAGMDTARLFFGKRLDVELYLARYAVCDLFLDTVPYNCGTTANDVLWMGLPLLTLLGESMIGRMAASLLTGLDMPQMIARDAQQYVELAVTLASDTTLYAQTKAKLQHSIAHSGVFDCTHFTRLLEQGYRLMAGEMHGAQNATPTPHSDG